MSRELDKEPLDRLTHVFEHQWEGPWIIRAPEYECTMIIITATHPLSCLPQHKLTDNGLCSHNKWLNKTCVLLRSRDFQSS